MGLKEVLQVPIVAAGGVTGGSAMVAAFALGASAVSLGTRFATSAESTWHENFKQEALKKDIHDTLISDKFGGSPNRLMRTVQAEKILKSRTNPLAALFHSVRIAREMEVSLIGLAARVLREGPRRSLDMLSMASMQRYNRLSFDGDVTKGTIHAGQSVGLIHDVKDVATIIASIVEEAEETIRRLAGNRSGPS